MGCVMIMYTIVIVVCEFPIFFLFDLRLSLMQYIFIDGQISRQKTRTPLIIQNTYFAKIILLIIIIMFVNFFMFSTHLFQWQSEHPWLHTYSILHRPWWVFSSVLLVLQHKISSHLVPKKASEAITLWARVGMKINSNKNPSIPLLT